MFDRLLSLFGFERASSRSQRLEGAAALEEGFARRYELGDPDDEEGVTVVVCRLNGELRALDALCPHEGGRIVDGPLVEGRYLRCPLHAYDFDPVTGAAIDVDCPRAKVYRVRESEGGDAEIWI